MGNGGSSISADFLNAHERHWEDGEFLFDNQRWGNADHLYGIGAECGLKAVLIATGINIDHSGSPEKPYREHVNLLWPLFHTFMAGRQGANLARFLPQTNPFDNWNVSHRYANSTYFTEAVVANHRTGAVHVRHLVKQARRDGVL